MARATPVPMDRVHRPRLTKAQATLHQQYQPRGACPSCQEQAPEWLMEVPIDGKPLEFYCTSCGHYRFVQPPASTT